MSYKFDAKKQKDTCVEAIRKWFGANGGDETKAVIGISAGKDSTVVAALCAEALGVDRVVGVSMPCGVQSDEKDVALVFDHLKIPLMFFANIEGVFREIQESLIGHFVVKEEFRDKEDVWIDCRTGFAPGHYSKHAKWDTLEWNDMMKTNTPARLRMTLLYAVAGYLNGRVMNTCNLSETFVGWETKFGDGAGDFSPIGKLTCSEVIQIGEVLGIPDELLRKAPADGLQSKTDEEAFGFTYAELDDYIRKGRESATSQEVIEKIERMRKNAQHKIRIMPVYNPCLGSVSLV